MIYILNNIVISFVPPNARPDNEIFFNEKKALSLADGLVRSYVSGLPSEFHHLQETISHTGEWSSRSYRTYTIHRVYHTGVNPEISFLLAFRRYTYEYLPARHVPRIIISVTFTPDQFSQAYSALLKATDMFLVEMLYGGTYPEASARLGSDTLKGKDVLEHYLKLHGNFVCDDGDYCYFKYHSRTTTRVLTSLTNLVRGIMKR